MSLFNNILNELDVDTVYGLTPELKGLFLYKNILLKRVRRMYVSNSGHSRKNIHFHFLNMQNDQTKSHHKH